MIKSELVQRIAQQRLGLNSRDVAKVVDTIERNCCSSHARRIGGRVARLWRAAANDKKKIS